MEHKLALRVQREAMCERIRYVDKRREKVAHVALDGGMSVKDTAVLLGKFTDYVCTHLGTNAHGTTLLQKGRTKEHKARQGRRNDAAAHTAAHNVDLQRTWLHFRSHFVPGGMVWVNMGRREKRRMRCAIAQADIHLSTYGDYVGAFAIVKGE